MSETALSGARDQLGWSTSHWFGTDLARPLARAGPVGRARLLVTETQREDN